MAVILSNNAGQVVGNAVNSSNQSVAFVYSGGVLYDLNTLIPPNTGWRLDNGWKINDSGQIAGDGMLNGARRGFRLDPTALGFVSLTMIETLASLNLEGDSEFVSLLQVCISSLERGNTNAARAQLGAFQALVSGQRGKKLTQAQADLLLQQAARALQMM